MARTLSFAMMKILSADNMGKINEKKKNTEFLDVMGSKKGIKYRGLINKRLDEEFIEAMINAMMEMEKEDSSKNAKHFLSNPKKGRNLNRVIEYKGNKFFIKMNVKNMLMEVNEEMFYKFNTMKLLENEFNVLMDIWKKIGAPEPVALLKTLNKKGKHSHRVLSIYNYYQIKNLAEIAIERDKKIAKRISLEMPLKLYKLHTLGTAHLDISSKNIGITDEEQKLILFDFETSQKIDSISKVVEDIYQLIRTIEDLETLLGTGIKIEIERILADIYPKETMEHYKKYKNMREQNIKKLKGKLKKLK